MVSRDDPAKVPRMVDQQVDVQKRISQIRQRLQSARPGLLDDAQGMVDDIRPDVLDRFGGRVRDLRVLQGGGPLDAARDVLQDRGSPESRSSDTGSDGSSGSSGSDRSSSRGGYRGVT